MKNVSIVLAAILALTLTIFGTAAAQPKGGRDGAQKQRHTSSQQRAASRETPPAAAIQVATASGMTHAVPRISTSAFGG